MHRNVATAQNVQPSSSSVGFADSYPYPLCPFGTFPPDRGNRPLKGKPWACVHGSRYSFRAFSQVALAAWAAGMPLSSAIFFATSGTRLGSLRFPRYGSGAM